MSCTETTMLNVNRNPSSDYQLFHITFYNNNWFNCIPQDEQMNGMKFNFLQKQKIQDGKGRKNLKFNFQEFTFKTKPYAKRSNGNISQSPAASCQPSPASSMIMVGIPDVFFAVRCAL